MRSTPAESPTPSVALSFILIARNQARTILDSVASAQAAAARAGLRAFEIIYVDSCSTDGSLELVEARYGEAVRRVSLAGQSRINAAIARNAGARVARGAALFFVDGDMEIDPDFLLAALDGQQALIHPLIIGQLPERFYSSDWTPIGTGPDRYRIRTRGYRGEIGGVLLVSRKHFEEIHGFRPELRVNEDLDFGLRMAEIGVQALTLPQPIALHHTIEYFDWSRLWGSIRDGSLLYPGALFRRHILNPAYWPLLASHQRPTIVLVLAIGLAVAVHPAWILLHIGYVAAKSLRNSHQGFWQTLIGTTARSVSFLLGALLFRPRP